MNKIKINKIHVKHLKIEISQKNDILNVRMIRKENTSMMTEKKLQEKALELRREYQREWRRKNKDKVRANNRRYWERKAQKAQEAGVVQ